MIALSTCLATAPAAAFTHLVAAGDTLASIAEKYYGRIQFERLLVAANFLDARAGTPIVRGMRLEVPAVGHRRIVAGDTWEALATELLGAPVRADVLSIANGSSPWLPPEVGSDIIVPYNLRVVVGRKRSYHAASPSPPAILTSRGADRTTASTAARSCRGLLWAHHDFPLTRRGAKRRASAAGMLEAAVGVRTDTARRQELPRCADGSRGATSTRDARHRFVAAAP